MLNVYNLNNNCLKFVLTHFTDNFAHHIKWCLNVFVIILSQYKQSAVYIRLLVSFTFSIMYTFDTSVCNMFEYCRGLEFGRKKEPKRLQLCVRLIHIFWQRQPCKKKKRERRRLKKKQEQIKNDQEILWIRRHVRRQTRGSYIMYMYV